jgi:cell division septation protein DedD
MKMAFGRKLRNRLVGLLVLVSLVLILMPMIMKPEDTYKKSDKSIAVDQNGAVTDNSGRMVENGEHDYSDLLAPVEDNGVNPGEIAAQNSGVQNQAQAPASDASSSGAIVVPPEIKPVEPAAPAQSAVTAPAAVPARPAAQRQIPSDPDAQVEMLKSARKSAQSASSAQSQPKAQQKGEVLKSTRQKAAKAAAQAKPAAGTYSVQVGVFGNPANAQKIASKLRAAGISVRTEKTTLGGKPVVRVLAGSASSREAARSIAARVSQITGSKANVVAN